MVTGVEDVGEYERRTGRLMSGYADGWLMWRVPDATQRCSKPPLADAADAADAPDAALLPADAADAAEDTTAADATDAADPADDTTAALATPWDGDRAALASGVDVCGLRQAEAAAAAAASASSLGSGSQREPELGGTSGDRGIRQKFCVSESDVPHVLQLGVRAARIAAKMFPMPDNYAE